NQILLDAQEQVKKDNAAAGPGGKKTDVMPAIEDKVEPWGMGSKEEQKASGTYVAKVPVTVQLDGSHVSMVLRKYTSVDGTKQLVQLFDTSSHGSGYTMFESV